MKIIYFLFFFLLLTWGCRSEKSAETSPQTNKLTDKQTLQWVAENVDKVLVKHTFSAPNGMQMPYRLFSPEQTTEEEVPLVVFLHGRGDRGTDNGQRMFQNIGLFMNEMSLVAPNMQAEYPCYVLVPQCSDKTVNEEWAKWVGNTPETPFKGLGKDGSYAMNDTASESGVAALALIDKIIHSLNIDPDRVYLVGISMGGFGTWEFTARRPNLFAAAVPMAGFSDPNQIDRIKHIPFWIFHGNADEANPVEGSRAMNKLLKDAGAEVKYTELDGADHGQSFKLAFQEKGLIPWMFSKKK